jgi:amidohydrolase
MAASVTPSLLEQARSLSKGIVNWRRTIHANPELGFKETKTATLVADALRKMGYDVEAGVGGTGVIASMRSPGYTGEFVGIRADMDALPITEANECDYASTNGAMHACGHDAHVACALGAAKILSNAIQCNEAELAVRFLFQPAEEITNEEGKSGATLLLEGGALKGVKSLIALHVWPGLPTGSVALKDGYFLAACDSFNIKIRGKGCHGAQPEQGVDAIVLATHVVQTLQTLISRRKAATDAAVLTIGGIRSSSFAPNVVAAEVELTGTVRYFKPEFAEFFEREINAVCSMVEPLGGSYEIDYFHETPPLKNEPAVTATMRATATQMLGAQNVFTMTEQLGAEDFAFYTDHVPCCFVALGVARDDRTTELHSPNFDINEDALPIGAALLAQAALALSKKA